MSTPENTPSSEPAVANGAAGAKRPAAKRASRVAKTSSASTRHSSASRARTRTASTTRGAAATRTRRSAPSSTIETVGGYAERAVLIPVGAALIARDRLLAGVRDLPRDPSDANERAQAQLRRFERRGTSARNSLEREARRTRVQLERELRRRRRPLDRAARDLRRRRSSLSRSITGQVEDASAQVERKVQARVKHASSFAGKVQGRVRELV
jgi:hypothetical protein